ncbi:nitroreductase family deazaflavin-dependent oxidoreductase [Mycolicibacterium pulveris]|uniref:Nitroreductase n=1 Tax=Mycolicibacterium pulveris TaxID=36813 RepID=A0A7I7UIY8_MYCPV|nr:nitroreductase family deazaflavin-dependent oxidoreductase [Mycolicibacterium pulveris]MCV6979485.1 nitroreductase family deazaflavin-dependent oxidoreductase [Mycolicibacterium pulveris]BBY81070.1 nitroreductase [Mycolicibacterium pulveris]
MDPTNKPKQLNSPIVTTVMKYAGKAHVWVYRRTGGRVGANWRVGAGFKKPVPTLLLEHIGRKTGRRLVSPLVFIRDGDDVIVVASQGGRDTDPQWYRNLVANPDAYIEIGSERRPVRAVTADPEQRARLWPKLVEAYADFDTYQAWADREIPVVILQPR